MNSKRNVHSIQFLKTRDITDELEGYTLQSNVFVGATDETGETELQGETDNIKVYLKGVNGGLFDIIFVADGIIYAPQDSSYLFADTNSSSRFANLKTLKLNNFDTSNVTNMFVMFGTASSLTELDISKFDTSKVENMRSMFTSCSNLYKVECPDNFGIAATTMNSMFIDCSSLTILNLNKFNAKKIEDVGNMFCRCSNLESLNLSGFDTSNATSFGGFCSGCQKLANIIGTINLINYRTNLELFNGCVALETCTLKNIKYSFHFGSTTYGTLLTNDTLINTIKELWDYSSGTERTLYLSTTSKMNIANIYVKLVEPTQQQIAQDPNIIYKKNCEVCDSTDDGAMLITDYATLKNWTIA